MKTLIISIAVFSATIQILNAQENQTKKLELELSDSSITDSLVYEITIFDPGFNRWLNSQAKPMDYYSQKYLETWNYQYVTEWNNRYFSGLNSEIISCIIDYEPTIEYGMEVNYQLYEYFRYVELELHVNLLSRPMR